MSTAATTTLTQGTVYVTAYTAAMMQPGTGSIHDNVTTEPGDIAFSDIQHNLFSPRSDGQSGDNGMKRTTSARKEPS
ncbi:hypothetical protein EN46_26840 [Citrobacter amalonaticus]